MIYFRNWSRGLRQTFVNQTSYGGSGNTVDDLTTLSNGPRRAGAGNPYSYWFVFAGNVLGASGLMTTPGTWVYENDLANNQPGQIWALGWNPDNVGQTWEYYDPQVASLSFAGGAQRYGNWDWVNSAQTWVNGSPFIIPNSLYLPSAPAFFGGGTWPWVNPTTGATGLEYSASSLLPAMARYYNGTPNVTPND
jgi:hypothetical protein